MTGSKVGADVEAVPPCAECGRPLDFDGVVKVTQLRYHRECRKKVLARRNRARRFGTTYADELRRETHGVPCPVCGSPVKFRPGAWSGRYCDGCRDSGRARRHTDIVWVYKVDDQAAADMVKATECAACGRDFTAHQLRPHVDHDHDRTHVRGVICNQCNVGLGMAGDDPIRLRRWIAYLTGERATVSVDGQVRSVAYADPSRAQAWRTTLDTLDRLASEGEQPG